MTLAADHPDRTAGLILCNGGARLVRTDDHPRGWPPERYDQLLDSFDDAFLGDGRGQVRR